MKTETKIRLRQTVFPISAAAIWGLAFVAQSVGAQTLQPFSFNFGRSLIAVVFLGLVVLFRRLYRSKKNTDSYQNSKAYIKRLVLGGISGGVMLSLATNLQQFGIAESNAGKAAFITTLYIVLVPLIGLMLGKRAPAAMLIAVPIATVGMYFLCVKGSFSLVRSDILLILCALAFAVQIIIVDRSDPSVDGIEFSFVQFVTMTITSCVPAFIFERPEPSQFVACAVPLLYVGVLSSGVAYTLQILAQKDSDPTVVSLLLSLESVFAAVFAALIQPETVMSGREYLGCVLMFAAVIISQIPFKKRTHKNDVR